MEKSTLESNLTRTTATRYLGGAIALVLVASAIGYVVVSVSYFSRALAQYRADPLTVRIGDHDYVVDHGNVRERVANPFLTVRILRTAYALTLAERAPLAALVGTDPERLRRAVDRLEKVMATFPVAAATSSPANQGDAAALGALYPTRFLHALADAETARLRFLDDHSEGSSRRYADALIRALDAGDADVARFTAHLAPFVGNDTSRISDIGGTIYLQNLLKTARTIEPNLKAVRRAATNRAYCLSGALWLCSPRFLAIPEPGAPPLTEIPDDKISTARDVRTFLASAMPASVFDAKVMIVLATSTCLGTLPGPYFFTAPSVGTSTGPPMPYLLNDIFFTKTESDAPMLKYLRTTRGMAYTLVNPLTYYRCPDVGMEISNVMATALTLRLILENDPAYDATLSSGPQGTTYFSDAQAIGYLAHALPQESDAGRRAQMVDLILMYNDRSAGLDRVVNSIADTQESHGRSRTEGLSIETSLRTLYLSQSAFMSLFQVYNRSFFSSSGPRTIRTLSIDPLLKVSRYTELRAHGSTEGLMHDLVSFFSMERPQ